jgi:prolyl oligopeptidase
MTTGHFDVRDEPRLRAGRWRSATARVPRTSSLRGAGLLLALAQIAGCTADRSPTRLRPPAARTVDVVDDYHGTKVADPYRWLEELESAEVRDWAAAQTAFALPMLRGNDVWPWTLARIAELDRFWEEPATEPEDPEWIDERSLGEGKSLSDIWPSPNRTLAVYAVSDGGSEWVETRIRDLATGRDLDERLDGLLWSDATWTLDDRGFFYVRSERPALRERTLSKAPALCYHVVGTPQSADVVLYQTPPDTTDRILNQEMSADGRFVFLYEGHGAHDDGIGWLLTRLSVLDLGDPQRPVLTGGLVPLTECDAAYRVVASAGETLYLFTDRGAPRGRVVALDLRQPAPESWRDVVPQGEEVIEEVLDIGGLFVVRSLRDVQNRVRVIDRDGRLVRELPIPPMTAVTSLRRGASGDELIVEAMEGGFAPTRTRHDLRSGTMTVERAAKLPFAAGEYVLEQAWYPAKDGVRVPMFVAHRSDLRLDGSHPTLLLGYGASSQSTQPWVDEWGLAALELGLVIAIPALRGGGEFGRDWYEAAILDRKQTSFDDFIAAAEHLIREGYTSPDRLAIHGVSNGGLLVTAVINQRPELFRVAVAEVPMADALRYDRGRHNAQFGSPRDPAAFAWLRAYSPQQNVKPGACYPATLITTALNDDRAPAWMALKFTAALQAAQGCERPIVLRVDDTGGHGGNPGDEGGADVLAFVAGELGLSPPSGRSLPD